MTQRKHILLNRAQVVTYQAPSEYRCHSDYWDCDVVVDCYPVDHWCNVYFNGLLLDDDEGPLPLLSLIVVLDIWHP